MRKLRIGMMGTPCGGTRFLSECLRGAGLDIAHEPIARTPPASVNHWSAEGGQDGLVCGLWWQPDAIRSEAAQRRPRPWEYRYDVLGVVVRHPLLVAQTLPATTRKRDHYPWWTGVDVVDALRFWVEAHEQIRRYLSELRDRYKAAAVVRIDPVHLPRDLAALSDVLGVDVAPNNRPLSKKRRWDPVTWDWWRQVDPGYHRRGARLVAQYDLGALTYVDQTIREAQRRYLRSHGWRPVGGDLWSHTRLPNSMIYRSSAVRLQTKWELAR